MTPTRARILTELVETAIDAQPPATEAAIDQFERTHSLELHAGLRQMHRVASGLQCNTWLIALWPLSHLKRLDPNSTNFLIGDFILDSEDIVADLTDPSAPIALAASHTILAPNFDAFLEYLLTNEPFTNPDPA